MVQELATRALDHNAVGALEQPQDYTHRAPATIRVPRHSGPAHGRRGEFPPWVAGPRTSPLGIVLPDDQTPVRNFSGQNRIDNNQLSMAPKPTSSTSQPRRTHDHWARGIASTPRVVVAHVEPVSTPAQNIARSAAEIIAVAEARGVTTQPQAQTAVLSQAAVEAPVIVEVQSRPTVQPQHTSTMLQVHEPSDIDFSAVVYYLDRSTQPAKIGKAQVHLTKARVSTLGSFQLRFAVSLSHLQPASYQVRNIRLPEPIDLESHRVTLACKKESDGPEDLHLMQFEDGEILTKFMTTLNHLREAESAQPTSADPVSTDSVVAQHVPAEPVPVEPTFNKLAASTIGTDDTSDAPTTQVTETPGLLPVHPEVLAPRHASQAEVSTPPRKTASVEVTTGSTSTPAVALPSVLVSHNTPSPGRHRSPPDLVSLDSSPGSDSPAQSATQDLAGLQPWYTHEAAVSTATAEVGRLANDLSTLTISTPAVLHETEHQAPSQNRTDTQAVEHASTATLAEQEEAEITVIQAETHNTVDDKTAMRNALHRLEDSLMDLFQPEDGGLPGDMVEIQQTIKGIKQAVASHVQPLLKEPRYFGGLTEDEKTQVLEEFLGEELPADDVSSSKVISQDSPSPSVTTTTNPPAGDSTTVPRIEYTFDQIHALYRDDYPAPQRLFELEISPMILNSHNRAAIATEVARPTAMASTATDELAPAAAPPPVNEPTEDATWGDNDTADDTVVEEVSVKDAKEEEKPKNTVKPASGTARDLANRFRSFKISTPARGTNNNPVADSPVHDSTDEAIMATEETAIVSEQINGEKTEANALDNKDQTTVLKEVSDDTLNEVIGSNEPDHGDSASDTSAPAALNPAAAHFAPVVTVSDNSSAGPVVAPITLATPRPEVTRGLGSSRWANPASVRITSEGRFTGVTVRTDRV